MELGAVVKLELAWRARAGRPPGPGAGWWTRSVNGESRYGSFSRRPE